MVVPSDEFPGYAVYSVNSNYADTAYTAQTANYATQSDTANTALTANYATQSDTTNSVIDYSETLLSGLTEDDVPVTFYILTKN